MACADAAPPTVVRLHLIDRVGLSSQALRELRWEAVRPWLVVGVVARWSDTMPQAPAVGGDGHDVYVIATAVAAGGGAVVRGPEPLASILFVEGEPTPLITAYAADVGRLLDGLRVDGERLANRPRRFRDGLLGRALGRAVAHELGHFLFASSAHARVGLMRGHHRLDTLIAPADVPFKVSWPATPTCLVTRLEAR
jgi:hypothetical protein